MNAASLAEVPAIPSQITVAPHSSADTHALGESIAALAARLHAATYELLVLLADFDARTGWNTGFMSCANWLHWRTGIDLGAAREKVRVARALPALLRVSEEMQRGRLSYAKVRALTRVATPDNEAAMLDLALAGTAAHVERFVRAWRRVDRAEAAKQTERQHLQRQVSTWVDDDGMVVIRGRLTPEAGAVVQRALEAAADRLFREGHHAPTGGSVTEEVTAGQRRADALVLMAETALPADLDRGTAGDRYQVVLHVSANAEPDGAVETDHGASYVSAETSRRLACDASVVHMHTGGDGVVVAGSRKTRTIPPHIRRGLAARDRTCRFPGCTSRRCDAHHIVHWADDGETSLQNLVLLCRRHHRAVHEGGFGVTRTALGEVVFSSPGGEVLDPAPAPPRTWRNHRSHAPVPLAGPPVWDGTRFDVVWAIDVMRPQPST